MYIEKPVFNTAIDKGLHCDDLADLINLAHNTEHYTLVPDIYSDEDVGRYFMDQQTLDGQTLNFLEDYIDYEKFGIDYADDNNCFLLDDGVLLDSDGGAAFHTEYDGYNCGYISCCRTYRRKFRYAAGRYDFKIQRNVQAAADFCTA